MTIEDVARALVAARRARRLQAAAPFAGALADAAQAYAVQDRVAEALGFGQRSRAQYWKSGGPSAVTQTHAPLPPHGVHTSPAYLRADDVPDVGIEAEIAFRVGRDAHVPDIADAVDAMCVSIELVHTRWAEGLDAPPLLKLADLQAHGALVLGDWEPLRDVDWAAQPCRVAIGDTVSEFRGSHSFGDPLGVLPHWAAHLAGDGGVVRAGTVVTTGTWCGLLWAHAGDEVVVEFPGIGRAQLILS